MISRHQVLAVLARHIGRANGIRARDLAAQLGCSERELRQHISDLIIDDRVAVIGTPKSGYHIAANKEETMETVAMHQKRALHELLKASRLSGVPLMELAGQLRLPT